MEPQATADPQPQPTSTPPQAGTSAVPASWPGAFGLFKHSRQAVRVNLGPVIIVLLLSLVLGVGLQAALGKNAGQLLSEIVSIILSVASINLYLAGSRGTKLSFGQAFPKDFMLYLKYIGLSIIIGVVAVVSILLLIIPFFIVMPRLALAPYFLIDKNMGVMEAYKASWAASKGHSGKVWGIIGVTIVFAILCLVLVGIYLLIMYSAAFAILYMFIQQNAAANPPAAAPPVAATVPTPAPTPITEPPVSSAPQDQQPQPPVTPSTPPVVQ